MGPHKKTFKLNQELREAAFFKALEQHADTEMMRAQRGQILWNVYREFYDIPKDLYVRKTDPLMRLAVRTSEAFNRADKMRKDGINPSLIFFSKTMSEPQIQHCVKILQADKVPDEKKVGHFSILKEINDMLVSNTPQLHLMFYEGKIFKYDELPGFFNVPCHFEVQNLK